MSHPGELRFDGKVALVTGAGGGLGRCYALLFGERGASVVVNDLGGDIKGGGQNSRPADKVVEEIRAKGGKAVANYDSVEDGEKLVQTALDNFGRIDIIVNNAGILRDRSFARISDDDWDIIQRVHLRGSFLVTRAAWPHMRKQKYGRIIMTCSTSGIYGNFGQANYSAAKLGLMGLTNTLAIEGQKYNIHCNTIAPTAGSRLTATILPEDILNTLKPDYVAPVVGYLCHESCEDNGGVFEVGGGWAAKLRWQKTQGAIVRSKDDCGTLEKVRDNWEKISDFSDGWFPANGQETQMKMHQMIATIGEEEDTSQALGPEDDKMNPAKAKAADLPPGKFTYTTKDAILYALGVGASTSQPDHLNFLYENAEDFCVIPTYALIAGMMSARGLMTGEIPGIKMDPTQLLHGEQYLEVYRPMPSDATVVTKPRIVDILDKGKAAVIVNEAETSDENGEKLSLYQGVYFVRGAGGFGGSRDSTEIKPLVQPPKRNPDATLKEKTGIDQAAIYRLSGDINPLHIDPSFAAMGGFSKPILHGLCSFGYATRHVIKQYANGDMSKFKAIKARFSGVVYPGETIQTDMWQEGSRICFRCKVPERDSVVLSGAYIDLVDVSPSVTQTTVQASSPLKSTMVFQEIAKRVEASPDLVNKVKAIFQWNVTKDGKTAGQWTVDLKNGKGSVYEGEPKTGKAGCTLTLDDEDLVAMVTGKMNAQKAFMTGKMKLKGNMMLAQKLGALFQEKSKL